MLPGIAAPGAHAHGYARGPSAGHGREHGKKARREERRREQGEAAEKGNQTSSTPPPWVVTGRPLHATKIANLLTILCTGGWRSD
jgi:hypothetical protein